MTEKHEEHWIKAYWRPAMGWLYMAICFVDFILFPLLAMFMPMFYKTPYVAWKSLTLDNGGLIHLAFAGILGVAAWSRGQEKLATIHSADGSKTSVSETSTLEVTPSRGKAD